MGTRIVRINALNTAWGHADAEAVAGMAPDAVLLPKVTSAGDIDMLAKVTGSLPIWAMMETLLAVLQASEIARHVLHGMVMGTNDLLEDLQSRLRPDRLALIPSLAHCVLRQRRMVSSSLTASAMCSKMREACWLSASRVVIWDLTERH